MPIRPNRVLTGVLMALSFATPAFADIAVRFDEGAPKDRFTFVNTGACSIANATLTVDLSKSPSGLIFDVTGAGAGVEVFQPFDVVSGSSALATVPRVRDGDNKLKLELKDFAPKQSIAFTIDIDDTLGGREITVSDSEIQGAQVMLSSTAGTTTAAFSSGSKTTLKAPQC